jgi:protein-S-isoprenylcysteine O-methyltransferase Ste14
LLNRYLLAKPSNRLFIELPIIIIIGALGEVFSWQRIGFSPYSHIIGGIIVIPAFCFHEYCHRYHKQAHERSQQIQGIVTKGPFSKIRHPMYISLIMLYLGIAVAWGIVWMFIPVVVFAILTILTALKEEQYMLGKFGQQYQEYMKQAPWRMIPKIF